MSNSSLVSYTRISPNRNSPREHAIDTITIHCYVGQASVEDMGAWFARQDAQASANYGIGNDGRIGMYVEEIDRSWCSSSRENDHRAITIECACLPKEPYSINASVYASLIRLVTDVCRRNGIKKLVWSEDKNVRMKHLNGANMTVHRDYANKSCPGTYIYSRLGQIAAEVNAQLTAPAASGIPASKQDFIDKVSEIAVRLYEETRILPSVVIAQACLESGYGLGADAVELTKRNNLLGMKADLINSTWSSYTVWDGKTFEKVTPEYRNGKLVYVTDSFRIYRDYENCIRDYEEFLLHVRNDLGYKYRSVQGMTDPEAVITAISRGGYATDPAYITKVMKIIKENNLTQYDKGAKPVEKKWYRVAQGYTSGKYVGQVGAFESKDNAISKAKATGLKVFDPDGKQIYPSGEQEIVDRYVVRRAVDETGFDKGKFHVLQNARNCADKYWGYKVFDLITKKLIYEPVLARSQKLCAAAVRLAERMVASKKDWRYSNTTGAAKTFWKALDDKQYWVNCMGGVLWAMVEAGLPRNTAQWYGGKGKIVYLNSSAEANLRQVANIIEIGGKKTVAQLIQAKQLAPGDILTYKNMNHTNMYLNSTQSFDCGHAYCSGSGEGAKFTAWVGKTTHPNAKVMYIIRMK